jgi:hypothetical protein
VRILSFSALLFILFNALTLAYAGEPVVEFFSPQGVVKGVRQVSVRFSEQMVTFGDFRSADPFDIKCPQKGSGRWADTKNWIYDFDKDLPAGVECEFSLKPDLKTYTGQGLTGVQTFVFSTGGPAIIRSIPREGQNIDEDQVFVLYTDAEPADESVISNVWCSIEDINERVGVRVLGDEEKEKIIEALNYRNPPTDFATLVQCRRHFANDKLVKLVCNILRKRRRDKGRSDTHIQIEKSFYSEALLRAREQGCRLYPAASNDRAILCSGLLAGGREDRVTELHEGIFSGYS